MNCPIDGTQLAMAERHGVEIDYCPQCRGIWLDRGELDKIIDAVESEHDDDRKQRDRDYEDDRRSRDYDDDNRRDRDHNKRRQKRSPLSSFFESFGGE